MNKYKLPSNYMEKETTNNSGHVDFKNVIKLKNNINPHSRMYGRKRTGMTAKEQRDFARATKRARFMALVPYISY